MRKTPSFLLQDRFPSLDGIRAIAICLVLAGHLLVPRIANGTISLYVGALAPLGVQLFFVLSGFLITALLLKEQLSTGSISLKQFYLRRAFRILPGALGYLFFLSIVNPLFHLQIPLKCLIGAALFLGNVDYFRINGYTKHYWSLAVEEQYYLVFPLLVKAFRFSTMYILLCLFGLMLFFKEEAFWKPTAFPQMPQWKLLVSVFMMGEGVLIGSLIAFACFMGLVPIQFIRKYAKALGLLSIVGILIFYADVFGDHALNSTAASFAIGLLLLCVMLTDSKTVLAALNNRVMVTVGKLSFSIYIWQQFFMSNDGRLGVLSSFPLNILLIAVVSCLSYYGYELKIQRLKKRVSLTAR